MISKADRNIWFSFIGDRNQAIYGNLGGIAKSNVELSNMFNLDFQEYSLSDCYRSSQQIIDLYKNFAVDPVRIISKKKESEAGCIYFCDNINKTEIATFICRIVKGALEKGVPESEICIIAPVWYMLFPVISELKEQLPNVKFDSPEISPFKYDPMNPFYLVARLAFTFSEKGSRVRRKIAKEIIDILSLDFGIELPKKYDFFDLLKAVNEVEYSPKQNGLEYYKKIIERLMISMKINLSNEEKLVKCYNSFWENTMERIERYRISTSCDEMSRSFNERTGVVANTIYGVKGEEYDTVIAFGLLRGYVPHWSDIMNKNDNGKSFSMKLLYVLCSRAKQNLFLISEKGRMTKSKKPYESNRELKAVVTRPDSTCKRNGCFQSGCL